MKTCEKSGSALSSRKNVEGRTQLDADKVPGRPVAGADVPNDADVAVAQADALAQVERLDGCEKRDEGMGGRGR